MTVVFEGLKSKNMILFMKQVMMTKMRNMKKTRMMMMMTMRKKSLMKRTMDVRLQVEIIQEEVFSIDFGHNTSRRSRQEKNGKRI